MERQRRGGETEGRWRDRERGREIEGEVERQRERQGDRGRGGETERRWRDGKKVERQIERWTRGTQETKEEVEGELVRWRE